MESASDDDLISSIAPDVIKFLLLVFVKPHGNVMENTRSVQVTLHVLFAGPDQFHRLPDGPRDYDKAETVASQIQKVVIVPAYLPRLNASARFAPGVCDIPTPHLGCHVEEKGYVEMSKWFRSFTIIASFLFLLCLPSHAQQTLGSINGTVADTSGGVLGKVTVKIRNLETNLEQVASTKDDGSFFVSALPIGRYSVSFARDGFKTEVHDQIMVQGGVTTTVNGSLRTAA